MSSDLKQQTVDVDNSPAITSAVIATVAAVIAVLLVGLSNFLALILGLLALILFVTGVTILESRSAVTAGVSGIFISLLISGTLGTPVELLLLGMLMIIVAWDVGHNSIVLGRQIGRTSRTKRAEFTHTGITTGFGVVTAIIVYVGYSSSQDGLPVAALVFLLLSIVFLAWAIRV